MIAILILIVSVQMLGHCPPGVMSQQSDFLLKGEFDGQESRYGFSPASGSGEGSHSPEYMAHRYSINSLIHLVQSVSS